MGREVAESVERERIIQLKIRDDRIAELEAALKPFADYGKGMGSIPDDHPVTQGSALARRQVVCGDFKLAAQVLAKR